MSLFVPYERNIHAQLHRKVSARNSEVVWNRSYARLETACRRAVELMILEGQAGDVIEVFHNVTGLQIGTVKMSVVGKLSVDWVFDQAVKNTTRKVSAANPNPVDAKPVEEVKVSENVVAEQATSELVMTVE